MTRARTASLGVAILTAIQPLLGAVLMLCVSLVHHAATTLRMIFNRTGRDWHTDDAHEDLPQATSGIELQERTQIYGVILGQARKREALSGRDPGISVGPKRGLANDPHDAINQDARHKGEHDTVDVAPFRLEACLWARVPGEGRGPVLREAQPHIHRSALRALAGPRPSS